MNRFCQQAYVNPELAHQGSQSLLAAFDDRGLWLSNLVQPLHLVAELRQESCLLARMMVTQWTHQGETHKLVRLAEALMEAQPPVLSHEAGQVMALLAGLLGILRADHASRWLAASLPLLKDSVDPHLLSDARQWVKVGQLLASLPQEDRLLWNRRLRDPEDEWEWESPEALAALRRIGRLLKQDDESLPLFLEVLPPAWWELWREHRPADEPPGFAKWFAQPAFALGLGLGMAGVLSVSWLLSPSPSAEEEKQKSFAFRAVQPAGQNQTDESQKKTEVPAYMQSRLAEAAKIEVAMPELKRMHALVKEANPSEADPYVQGNTTIAKAGTAQHRALLRWLILDPPQDAAVRAAINKTALRLLGFKEMYETLVPCLQPDSPDLKEARESASLLLALGAEDLTEEQKRNLTQLAELK